MKLRANRAWWLGILGSLAILAAWILQALVAGDPAGKSKTPAPASDKPKAEQDAKPGAHQGEAAQKADLPADEYVIVGEGDKPIKGFLRQNSPAAQPGGPRRQ